MTDQIGQISPPFYRSITFSRADGVYLYDDINNKEYIDLSAGAGVAITGYNHKKIKEVMRKQIDQLIFSPQKYRTDEAERLLQKILSLFPDEYNIVVPAVTGSESVEIAMQMAINYSGKKRFLSFGNAYHGHTLATGALGARYRDYYFQSEFNNIKPPVGPKDIENALKEVEKQFATENFAAFVAEGVITNAGYLEIPSDFFHGLSQLCLRYGVLLIFDEVLTGFGRTGKMFSFEHHGISPDVVCLAKGLSSGYAAIAAVVTRREIVKDYDYFSTFAWLPLACRVAVANIDVIVQERLADNSRLLGEFALHILKQGLKSNSIIQDIRGKGLGIVLEFASREDALKIHQECLDRGVILFRNIHLKMLFIQPPLVISKNELEVAISKVVKIISDH